MTRSSCRPGRGRTAGLALLALLLATGCGSEVGDDAGQGDADLVVVYDEPADDAESAAAEELRASGLVGGLVAAVDEAYELPEPVTVRITSGTDGPYYDPEVREIALQYAFLDQVTEEVDADGDLPQEEARSQAVDVFAFVLLHEVGHAFIDVLDLPVPGREEDAVDGLATVLLVEHVEDGARLAVSAADWFAASADLYADEVDESSFADEHSLDLQRYYAILCLAAGLDEGVLDAVREAEALDEERLERCPADAEEQAQSWEQLLEPARAR